MARLRIGILGAGNIAGAFAAALTESRKAEVVAIGSRTQEKASAFASRFGLARSHGTYDELVDDPDIDVVYIATPNGVHKEPALQAARRGKHILCEKPMTLTAADAEEMFRVADENGVQLIEGFPYRFQPQAIEVLRRVRAGMLGEIVTAIACFGFRMRSETNVRLDPEQGGGAFWDVGVYALNLVRAVMGEAPRRVLAAMKLHRSGVDATGSAILEYADGRTASIWSSFETTTIRRANIVGAEGAIDYDHTNHTANADESAFYQTGPTGVRERIDCPFGNGFVFEADAFADLVAGASTPFEGTTRRETIENIATIEAILESARTGRAVDVAIGVESAVR